MKFIYNKFMPFGDFGLMNILGFVFSRKPENKISKTSKRHEGIHTPQQYELLTVSALISLVLCNFLASWWYLLGVIAIPFIIYALAFLLEMIVPPYHNAKLLWNDKSIPWYKRFGKWVSKVWVDAYRDNCFEREAYANQHDPDYLVTRPLFAWRFYIIPKDERRE